MTDGRLAPLLPGVSQFEVDFVVPRLGVDLPLGIDPFLLFKSREAAFAELHGLILIAFNAGIEALRRGRPDEAKRILNFPEVSEIGLGSAVKNGKRGSGVGTFLSELIIQTLGSSPALLDRGVRHIEEMQLVSVGIGPDRISDIAANLIKNYLIDYTQRQSALWSIPLTPGVPVSHVFDHQTLAWEDGYFDLPVSPVDQQPILLVPRRIVRALPWINYDDFFRMEFTAYLKAKQIRGTLPQLRREKIRYPKPDKAEVVAIAQAEVERVDRYVIAKEREGAAAQPSQSYLDPATTCRETKELKARLAAIPTGRAAASDYQHTILAILNFLFIPELIDGETEVRTVDGTERRDIIFLNDSDTNFWEYVRGEHSALYVMFEAKNMDEIEAPALNQTNTYLGDRLGRLAFIATRKAPGESQKRKAYSIYNDSHPRKVVLFLSDTDFAYMLDMKCKGNDPSHYIQNLYRKFRTSVQ